MSTTPDTAMVLAAGLGLRMRPITERIPKPLVPVDGRPMIDYVLDRLVAAGIATVVVNVHHLADQMIEYLARRTNLRPLISDETGQLMESGGGLVKALPKLGSKPFFILNADTFWLEPDGAESSNLRRLAGAWDNSRMEMLLLTTAFGQTVGYEGRGDFLADPDGRLRRYDATAPDPLVYPGVGIVDPRIFADAPDGPFSLNRCFDRAIGRGRLYGLSAQGLWLTVGTPEAVGRAEVAIRSYRSGDGMVGTVA